MQTSSGSYVLDAREFKLVEGLRLSPRKSFSGRIRGERLTRKKGVSIEFADYREYAEGDDLRHLDWNVLARLENAVVKTYQDEEDLAVYVLLDCSPSMEFSEPRKIDVAKKIACGLGFMGMANGDAVYPYAVGKLERPLPALRGRSSYRRLAMWASALEPDGSRSLGRSIRDFCGSRNRAGLAILITDGLDPDLATQIRILGGQGHEVWLVQVLGPEEIDPDIEGDLRLLDAEDGQPVEITANSLVLNEYRKRLEEHCETLRKEALRVGGRYLRTTTRDELKSVLLDGMKREGWLAG